MVENVPAKYDGRFRLNNMIDKINYELPGYIGLILPSKSFDNY